MEVIGIQTEVMINLPDDLNVGFSELYKKLRGIQDPVIVKQLTEEEIEATKINQEMEQLNVTESTSNT